MRCNVLFAGLGQHVSTQLMLAVRTQSSLTAVRREKFLGLQPVINCNQLPASKRLRGLSPPFLGQRTDLGGKAIRQNREQLGGQCRSQRDSTGTAVEPHPCEPFGFHAYSPFKPLSLLGVPP